MDLTLSADGKSVSDIGEGNPVPTGSLHIALDDHSESCTRLESHAEKPAGTDQAVSTVNPGPVSGDSGEAERPIILYYKQACRRRAPKNAQNVEFKKSRSRQQALIDAAAFEASEPPVGGSSAQSIRTDGHRYSGFFDTNPRTPTIPRHSRLRPQNQHSELVVPTRATVSGDREAVLPNEDVIQAIKATIAGIRDLKKQTTVNYGHVARSRRTKKSIGRGDRRTTHSPEKPLTKDRARIAQIQIKSQNEQRKPKSNANGSDESGSSRIRDLSGASASRLVNDGEGHSSPSEISPSPLQLQHPPPHHDLPLHLINNTSEKHRRDCKRLLRSAKMTGRPSVPSRYSGKSTRSQVDPTETHHYPEFTVFNNTTTPRSRTRGFQPAEVGKSKASLKTSEHESSSQNDAKTLMNGSHPSKTAIALPECTATSELASSSHFDAKDVRKSLQSRGKPKPQPMTPARNNDSDPTSRSQTPAPRKLLTSPATNNVGKDPGAKDHQKVPPHVAYAFQRKEASPITPTTQTSKLDDTTPHDSPAIGSDGSPTSSSESATVQVITHDEEKKPSFWFRATGSVPGTQEPLRPPWLNSNPTVDENASWDQPDKGKSAYGDTWAARCSRTGLGKMPSYKIPVSKGKTPDKTKDSIERQKSHVSPANKPSTTGTAPVRVATNGKDLQQYPISKEGEVLEKDPPTNHVTTPTNDAHVAAVAKPVTSFPSKVPPHLRLRPKSVNVDVSSQVKHKESDSKILLERMKAGIPGHLQSRAARNSRGEEGSSSASPQVEVEVNPELSKAPQAKSNLTESPAALITQPDTSSQHAPAIVHNLHSSVELKQSSNDSALKGTLPPHMRPRKAVEAEVTAPSDHTHIAQAEVISMNASHPPGSGQGDVVEKSPIATPEQSGPSPAKGKSRASRKASNVVSRNGSSTKKGKQPDFPVTEYEPQLADWNGNWMAAPVGDEWDWREKYHNMDERQAALRAYAEDHAVDPDKPAPVVDVNSPSFRAGKAVLDDEGIDELDLNRIDGLRFDPNTAIGIVEKANKTTADLMKGYKPKPPPTDPDPFDKYGFASMTKDQLRKRRQQLLDHRKNFVYPPNPYEPKANIYLRPVETKDAQQITDIWNHYVKNSAVNPLVDVDQISDWYDIIVDADKDREPFLVAVLLGDKATRDFGKIRRLKQEHIVGFARAFCLGTRRSIYRNTLELEVYVQDGHQNNGIGKTLLDRILAATVPEYHLKGGSKFISSDEGLWMGADFRPAKTLLFNILHHEDDESLKWKMKWIESCGCEFVLIGKVPNIGYKFKKPVHQTQYYYETNVAV